MYVSPDRRGNSDCFARLSQGYQLSVLKRFAAWYALDVYTQRRRDQRRENLWGDRSVRASAAHLNNASAELIYGNAL